MDCSDFVVYTLGLNGIWENLQNAAHQVIRLGISAKDEILFPHNGKAPFLIEPDSTGILRPHVQPDRIMP